MTVVSHCFGFVFIDKKSNFCCISDQFLSFNCYASVAVCKQKSSAKSRSPSDSVNVHMIPLLTPISVLFILQSIVRQNRNGDNTPVLYTSLDVKLSPLCWVQVFNILFILTRLWDFFITTRTWLYSRNVHISICKMSYSLAHFFM